MPEFNFELAKQLFSPAPVARSVSTSNSSSTRNFHDELNQAQSRSSDEQGQHSLSTNSPERAAKTEPAVPSTDTPLESNQPADEVQLTAANDATDQSTEPTTAPLETTEESRPTLKAKQGQVELDESTDAVDPTQVTVEQASATAALLSVAATTVATIENSTEVIQSNVEQQSSGDQQPIPVRPVLKTKAEFLADQAAANHAATTNNTQGIPSTTVATNEFAVEEIVSEATTAATEVVTDPQLLAKVQQQLIAKQQVKSANKPQAAVSEHPPVDAATKTPAILPENPDNAAISASDGELSNKQRNAHATGLAEDQFAVPNVTTANTTLVATTALTTDSLATNAAKTETATNVESVAATTAERTTNPVDATRETNLPPAPGSIANRQTLSGQSSGSSNRNDGLSDIDRVRFVQRVARAFQAASERDGEIRLKLSPPELGSLKLDISLRDGSMVARLEAETVQARNLLMEHLPQLKERLAEQNVRIESFEVNVRDQNQGHAQDNADQLREQAQQQRNRLRNTQSTTPVLTSPITRSVQATKNSSQLNLII